MINFCFVVTTIWDTRWPFMCSVTKNLLNFCQGMESGSRNILNEIGWMKNL